MPLKFSDRIGVTKVPDILQVNGMSAALRNSLWNYLLKTIFAGDSKYHTKATKIICERHFKLPIDKLPFRAYEQQTWLRNYFFHDSFAWHKS
ncbi:MAG: hypothetical protein GX147_05715 [Deltaproteobacteria bacterium]|nr:hypothetical protein [Deltaproteobacteria bacterium]